ncbi:MAG: cellulase family glycosylhydrolase [Verrucomicrobia bacterium]|nr:cellulase family glycosylhydrolase [Verrucomicrobiota bacterium]
MNEFQMDAQGYFLRNGQRFWPVGCNYTSASCGARIWQTWPEAEIRADLAGMKRFGFNTLRFFILWEDFEPEPGRYDPRVERRLQQFCQWCGECGICPHPSLFVGWMSGGIFWPPWKGRRNLFENAEVIERSLAFAQRCCVLLKGCDNLLAIDVGNEMSCLPDAHEAHPDAVRDWCIELLRRVKTEIPGVLVVPGNEQMMIFKDQGFRLTDPVGWDFYSAHGYPVPSWNECWMPGLRSPETQRRLPFYVKFLRAFGPVMLQEFGTIATFGAEEQRAYLKGMLERAWRAGANGFLLWCWKDIHASGHPYDKGGIERTLGLVDETGGVKPGLEPFIEFARELTSGVRAAPVVNPAGTVHLLLPQEWYVRDNQRNPGNEPAGQCEQYAGADSILDELGCQAVIVRKLDRNHRAPAIIPGAALRDDEIAALIPEVKNGQKLLWWAPNFYCWGPACRELAGAEIVDFFPDHVARFCWRDREWSLPGFPGRTMPVVRPVGSAAVEIQDRDGRPLLLRHKLGKGEIWTLLPLCATSAHPGHAGERAFATELVRLHLS